MNLTISNEDAIILRGMLYKLQGNELAELRSIQTQLLVYGEDRRSTLIGEDVRFQNRQRILLDLIKQLE